MKLSNEQEKKNEENAQRQVRNVKNTMTALVKKAGKGDADAFSQLMEQVKVQAYRMAYTYVKNEEDALEVVSESVYKAFKSIASLRNPDYFTTWFMRIVINNAITLLGKRKNQVYLDDCMDEKELSVGDENDFSADRIDLFHAIDRLSPENKTLIILRFYQDLKLEEIADRMQLPLSTVKSRLYKVLRLLKDDLEGGEKNGEISKIQKSHQ